MVGQGQNEEGIEGDYAVIEPLSLGASTKFSSWADIIIGKNKSVLDLFL